MTKTRTAQPTKDRTHPDSVTHKCEMVLVHGWAI